MCVVSPLASNLFFFLRWRCPSPKDNTEKSLNSDHPSASWLGDSLEFGATSSNSVVLCTAKNLPSPQFWVSALTNFLLLILFAFGDKLNTAWVNKQPFFLEREKGNIYILSLCCLYSGMAWLWCLASGFSPEASCLVQSQACRELHSQNRRSNGFNALARIRSWFSGRDLGSIWEFCS